MKSNLAYKYDMVIEPTTIGELVSDQACLCVSDDCPVETLLAMMSNMGTRLAAVVSKGGAFQGVVNRSALLGTLMIDGDFNVGERISTIRAKAMRAGDVMIGLPCFLPSELSIQDALEIMVEHGYSTMPVLDDNARFVGIAEKHNLQSRHNSGLDTLLMTHLMEKPRARITGSVRSKY